jgi:hypothetical protein
MHREKGQTSITLNQKVSRPAIAYRSLGGAPTIFLTAIVPYDGLAAPSVDAAFQVPYQAGQDRLAISLSVGGQKWELERELRQKVARIEKKR